MTKTDSIGIQPLEKLLENVERSPWNAMYRVAIGFLTFPVFGYLFKSDSVNHQLLFFASVLLANRLVPLVLRRVLPFSKELRASWTRRRLLAKQYDSYQWRKLFWIGLGIAIFVVYSGQLMGLRGVLALGCLISGSIGLVIWYRKGLPE